jgi:3-oxoacyl-[acyl-carrier protein] reductase
MANSSLALDGQVAIVTGGARGIGAAILLELSNKGATVVALDLDQMQINETLKSIPGESMGIAVDITKPMEVQKAINLVLSRFGRIDILVNNAGITRDALFHKMTHEEWSQVLDVNLSGAFYITQLAQGAMVKQGYGRIVFISSRSSLGKRGQANYAASKAALLGLAKTLAIELGQFGITVNAIAPGFIETEMTRSITEKTGQDWSVLASTMSDQAAVKRIGNPLDIANAVAFFCDPKSSFITGQTLYVTGSPTV